MARAILANGSRQTGYVRVRRDDRSPVPYSEGVHEWCESARAANVTVGVRADRSPDRVRVRAAVAALPGGLSLAVAAVIDLPLGPRRPS